MWESRKATCLKQCLVEYLYRTYNNPKPFFVTLCCFFQLFRRKKLSKKRDEGTSNQQNATKQQLVILEKEQEGWKIGSKKYQQKQQLQEWKAFPLKVCCTYFKRKYAYGEKKPCLGWEKRETAAAI